jgi:2-iminobutanoate/2-iminopropanoate deaminase
MLLCHVFDQIWCVYQCRCGLYNGFKCLILGCYRRFFYFILIVTVSQFKSFVQEKEGMVVAVNRKVVRFGPFKNAVANAVQIGNLVYLSGQVSVDSAGHFVGVYDLVAQVRQAYDNIAEVLARLDANLEDVVDETWFLTDMKQFMGNFQQIYAVREQAYGEVPATTQTVVQVAALAMPELMVEIKCIAYVNGDRQGASDYQGETDV